MEKTKNRLGLGAVHEVREAGNVAEQDADFIDVFRIHGDSNSQFPDNLSAKFTWFSTVLPLSYRKGVTENERPGHRHVRLESD